MTQGAPTTTRRLIGLSGYARSGKDTVASILVDNAGFTKKAFADPLRSILLAANPVVLGPFGTPWRLADVVAQDGWEGIKNDLHFGAQVRQLMQGLGTDGCRKYLNDRVFIDATLRDLPQLTVISDLRFPEEMAAIQAAGGEVWRVVRPGVGPANSHLSEVALDGYQFKVTLHNDSTVDSLLVQVLNALHRHDYGRAEWATYTGSPEKYFTQCVCHKDRF